MLVTELLLGCSCGSVFRVMKDSNVMRLRNLLLWFQRDTDANNWAGEFLHEGTARPLSKAAK